MSGAGVKREPPTDGWRGPYYNLLGQPFDEEAYRTLVWSIWKSPFLRVGPSLPKFVG